MSESLQSKIGALDLPLTALAPDAFGTIAYQIEKDQLLAMATRLRDEGGLTYLSCLTGLEWPDRFQVVYHLYDHATRATMALKVDTPKDAPDMPSVTPVWPAANWYEREVYDMYGLKFPGHPHLTRILMADDWEGHPLLKSYPMDVEGGY